MKPQSILKISASDAAELPRTAAGRVVLRCRVAVVSAKHQGRSFVLRVGPDLSADPLAGAVAAALSPPIKVAFDPPNFSYLLIIFLSRSLILFLPK